VETGYFPYLFTKDFIKFSYKYISFYIVTKVKDRFFCRSIAIAIQRNTIHYHAWGGRNLFEKLLSKLNNIAQKYNVRIANVATRYILDKAAIASVIIGIRLGIADLKNSNAQVFSISLGKTNYDDIKCEM
jgi:predicted aldo/keto reductase-like oxidoreductase